MTLCLTAVLVAQEETPPARQPVAQEVQLLAVAVQAQLAALLPVFITVQKAAIMEGEAPAVQAVEP